MRRTMRIMIGGFIYRVLWNYKFKERTDLNGQCDGAMQEIRISKHDPGGNEYHTEQVERIFWHEAMHMIGQAYAIKELRGGSEESEQLVERIASALHDMFNANRDIIEQVYDEEEEA